MNTAAPQTAAVRPHSIRGGRLRVALIFGLIIGLGMGGIVSGYLMRETLHQRAGNVRIELRNESGIRLKADLFLDEQIGWIDEMDPHEGGFIRFNPAARGPVQIRLYHDEMLLSTLEEGDFIPGLPAHVRLTIISPTEIRIEQLPVETEKQETR